MITTISKRLFQAVFVVWAVGTLSFIMMRLLPGNMAFKIAAGRYGYDQVNQQAADMVKSELALDRSAISMYFDWLGSLAQLDFGNSLVSGRPVLHEIQHQLGHSFELALVATIISVLIAVPIGTYCGRRANSLADHTSLFVSAILRAQPVFIIGLILILVFSIHFKLLPVAGFGGSEFIILPATALALSMAALSSRMIKNITNNAVTSSYYQFARLKGLSENQAFERHAKPNITLLFLPFLGVQAICLIEGIVMIESLFSWPGIGHALAHAIFSRDIPMIQASAMVMGLLFVAINSFIDLAVYLIDPRINHSASNHDR